jgi:hypothetical protein
MPQTESIPAGRAALFSLREKSAGPLFHSVHDLGPACTADCPAISKYSMFLILLLITAATPEPEID